MTAKATGTLRVGIVGAGFAAHLHGRAYRHICGVQVALQAVAATRPERAAAFAAEFGVRKIAPDLQAILDDPEVDVVDLCVPPYLHVPMGVAAAKAGKHLIVEKPLTGFFGDAATTRSEMLRKALASADELIRMCRTAKVQLCYAENWVYAPAIQKARRLLAASGGPILRITGEESHSGSHASTNKSWEFGGGGSLIGKACHPLGGALYLKADEGMRLRGTPIRPISVVAELARLADTPTFRASTPCYMRVSKNSNVEDWASMLITFEDGTVAQISASDVVLGGIRNQLALYGAKAVVFANISPNDTVQAYAPAPDVFKDEYIVQKIETKAGWTFPQPNEDWSDGFPHEMQDFVESVAFGREPLSGAQLARDVTAVIYGAYLSAAEGQRVDLRPFLSN